MVDSRRAFLAMALSAAGATALRVVPAAAQVQQPPPPQRGDSPPLPGAPQVDPFPEAPIRRDPRLELKYNQEHIKKDVARLKQLVADLQKGLDNDDTTEVLSLNVIHQTEEIEKLAKQIRDLIRG